MVTQASAFLPVTKGLPDRSNPTENCSSSSLANSSSIIGIVTQALPTSVVGPIVISREIGE